MSKIQKTEEAWAQELTPEQFHVCRRQGTERPFTGQYHACKTPGTYHCACCGSPLFSSQTKFDSGTGWPSFYAPVKEDHVNTKEDHKLAMKRVEVICSHCDAHLGHVFDDGPKPTGQRYCINSLALKLEEA